MNVNVFPQGDIGLLQIRYAGCNTQPDDVNVGPISRNSWIVHFVLRGSGWFNGAAVSAGHGFLITPGNREEYHSNKKDPWEMVWFVSDDPDMERLFSYFHADPETGVFCEFPMAAVEAFSKTLRFRNAKFMASAELLEMFLDIFKYYEYRERKQRPATAAENYVRYALEYLQANFCSDVTVEALTTLLGISQPYLYRIFRESVGVSPKAYLSELRLMEAKKLLSGTDIPVSEVALASGYADALAFSRFFSGKTGVSPTRYRREQTR